MMNGNHSWSSGNWVLMGVMMLVLWSLIAVAVVAVVRSLRGRGPAPIGDDTPQLPSGDNARQILDQRLARGDITEAEDAHSKALLHTP